MKTMSIMGLTLLLLMVVWPALLPAATNGGAWDILKVPLTQILGMVLTIFGVPLLIRWGRKLGVEIDEQSAIDAVNALINILVNIDLTGKNLTGETKKQMAVITARNTLSGAQQDILIKKYGSLEAAVQVAFEKSSLNQTKEKRK